MTTFDKAFKEVIGHEGGYVNDPSDRGGETKYGVSKLAYPNEDIKNLTLERAKELYKRDYWDKANIDSLPQHLQIMHFGFVVNFGIAGANKVLQKAAGVKPDGIMGSRTLAAAQSVTTERYICYVLDRYMRIIAARPANAKFAKGWSNRAISYL